MTRHTRVVACQRQAMMSIGIWLLTGSVLPHVESPWPMSIGLGFPFAVAGAAGSAADLIFSDAPSVRRDRVSRKASAYGFRAGLVRNPERSRQSFYRITDPYLRFWFRFVLPAQGRLTDAAGARRHLDGYVLPRLDEFVASPAFEEVCQEWLRDEVDAAAVGWWWGKVREMRGAGLRDIDRELDPVAVDEDGAVLAIASCKWTDGKMPVAEKTKLEALATHLRPDDPPALHLFSRSGFEQPLLEAAAADPRLNLVGVEQM